MEENQTQIEVASVEQPNGSGAILAAARKQQNRTVEEIAADLNLSVTQVKTIELDQTDGLPEPTYVRGYIRGYAKLLGLSPEDVLSNYLNPNWQQSGSLNEIPKGIGASTEESRGGFFSPVKSIVLLAIIGVIGYYWYTGEYSGFSDSDTRTSASEPVESSSAPVIIDEADQSELPDTLDDSGVVGEAEGHQLVLNFSETSWVDIRDENETRLAYKSYAPGETLDVSSVVSLSVFIGNAAGVSVEYNGLPFDISEHREGVYAKFVVGEP